MQTIDYLPGTEKRSLRRDRRKKPTRIISSHSLMGRRKLSRRTNDTQTNYYVDMYSANLFAILLLIIVLSILDALLTYAHINRGGKELNPIMQVLLTHSVWSFFFYKFTLTSLGVFVLCLHKNFTFVRSLISMILGIYVLLTFYHVGILYAY